MFRNSKACLRARPAFRSYALTATYRAATVRERLCGTLFLVAVLCLTAQAQTVPTPPRVGVGVIQDQLSLEQAVEMALRNNPEIDIEKANVAIAGAAARG